MKSIIDASIHTLNKSKSLLDMLSNTILSDKSIPPYFSSIGSHIRHIFDFYECALTENENGIVDLTKRERNNEVETCCNAATEYLESIITRLENLRKKTNDKVIVVDDLGTGKISINYTYEALIAQANSHAIHHYAIINYLLDRLGVKLDDDSFGYNPSTPIAVAKN